MLIPSNSTNVTLPSLCEKLSQSDASWSCVEWTIHSMCAFVDVKHNITGKLHMISTFFTFAIGITVLLGVLEP